MQKLRHPGLSQFLPVQTGNDHYSPLYNPGYSLALDSCLKMGEISVSIVRCYTVCAAIVSISKCKSVQIVDQVLALPERSKIQILAPIVRGRKGEHVKELETQGKAVLSVSAATAFFMICPSRSSSRRTTSIPSKLSSIASSFRNRSARVWPIPSRRPLPSRAAFPS